MNSEAMIMELSVDNASDCTASIENALSFAYGELQTIQETIDSVAALKPQCDKLDYILAASSGALCGIIDVFLVGKPGESPIGDLTDKWFANRTEDFAKLCGWGKSGDGSTKSAIRFLEKKFGVPYDQTHVGDAAKEVFNLTPSNHHFKSLGHNPTLLGLFFSILDQFTNSSHFVSGGQLLTLEHADDGFELRGNNIPAKLFCGFVNWFGHLMSDVSGSSVSSGRGMGIPSPIWAWTNDLIVIANKLHLPTGKITESMNDLAVKLFEEGFDFRFQTAQLIPVFLNEIIVRLFYSIRRMFRYFSDTPKENRSFKQLWEACEPFKNPTVKRMLTVAHGTFCLVDIGDATIRGFTSGGGSFNVVEFFLRLNVAGVGRFVISLYGEGKRAVEISKAEKEAEYASREKVIVENYIDGLKELSKLYNDSALLTFVNDFEKSGLYIQAFQKSVELAELRKVPEEKILHNKAEIDSYFMKGKK